jgi:predicted dehydrogenase/NADPH:quinone reductase-like Zn-dependent oxidoreductase
MRQLFLKKNSIVVKEVCKPLLDDYSLLIAVHYACISSNALSLRDANAQPNFLSNVPIKIKKVLEAFSDSKDSKKTQIKKTLEEHVQSFGYSCSGIVLATGGKVTKFRAGDLVACAGTEISNVQDVICVSEHLAVRVSNQQFLKDASLTTIGATALQSIRRAQLELGQTICVFGLGLLGQITVQLAKLSGCIVIAIDEIPERLAIAQKIGADYTFCMQNESQKNEINFITGHHGVDSSLITHDTESNSAIAYAIELTRAKGKVILVGNREFTVNRESFCAKEIDLLSSCSYNPGRFEFKQCLQDYPLEYVRWTEQRNMQAFMQLIEQGKIKLNDLITQEVSLDQVVNELKKITKKESLGTILRYTPLHEAKQSKEQNCSKNIARKNEVKFIPAKKDFLRVGFIGMSGFIKTQLLPIVSKLENVDIKALVDSDLSNAMQVSKLYGELPTLCNDDELFTKDMVDVVMISPSYKFHIDQAIKALNYGKAVFMEKPMALDDAQYTALSKFLNEHSQVPFCINYNRSFAPYILKIKKNLVKRISPLMIHYRMNVGSDSSKNPAEVDSSLGKIIGNACHIFDLFCFLTDSKPIAVSVESVHKDSIFPTDNFSAQIAFEDGSICTLFYTSLGHSHMDQERMELFFDSKSIVMNDYVQLHGFGFPNTFNETCPTANLGHENLIKLFFQALKKPTFVSPISLERLNMVTQLTLHVDRLACDGGGSENFSTQ